MICSGLCARWPIGSAPFLQVSAPAILTLQLDSSWGVSHHERESQTPAQAKGKARIVTRAGYARRIEERLGKRRLGFFGSRRVDVETLLEIRQLESVFSRIAPWGSEAVAETCVETLTGERVDFAASRWAICSQQPEALTPRPTMP